MSLWYLRSMADHDTHRGTMGRGGLVTAECGIQFTPPAFAFSGRELPGKPADPDQICPRCQLAEGAR
ncbi:MAG: hypothetical protein ACRDUV_22940 [Pseudonocardiaceae bacterium]